MGLPAEKLYTIPEYIALEASTGIKHEYRDGVVQAMAGGTPEHARVSSQIGGALVAHLRGKPCKPFSSDLKIKAGERIFYPDVSVLCPPVQRDPALPDAVLNARVIFEVISDTTEHYDRGEKFSFYRLNSEMTDYVLVSPVRVYAEHYTRIEGDRWNLEFLGTGSTLKLPSIGCELALDEFYEGLELLALATAS